MKLLSITWSDNDLHDYTNSFLYKSFLKNNKKEDFVNIHYNRQTYKSLESAFQEMYGYQSEYILYKIFLLREKLKENNFLENFVYADTNDVVVLDNIQKTSNTNNIIFSVEKHQYPKNTEWLNEKNYPEKNLLSNFYLNSGLFLTNKNFYIEFLNKCVELILPRHFKDYGGDQGIFTYYYINHNSNDIMLDIETKYFLSTYLRSETHFKLNENKILNLENNSSPMFIHDNGWNYGSPKFIEKFKLI